MTDELERMDRLLGRMGRILAAPGEEASDGSPEWTWQKLELLEGNTGPEALAAILRRQGMTQDEVADVLAVLTHRRDARA